MINLFSGINWNPGTPELRMFGKTVLAGLLIIAVLLLLVNIFRLGLPFPGAAFSPLMAAGAGMAVFLLSYFARPIAMPVYYVCSIAVASIRITVYNVLLTVFYYLIFTAVALILKSSGRDPLRLRKNSRQASYWIRHEAVKDRRRYFKQY